MPLNEKAAPGEKPEGVKKKTKKHTQSYQGAIYKVLKQVHPKMRISKQAMSIMESCVLDTFERLAKETNNLCRMSRKDTVTSREIQSAVRLCLPGELSKHAVSEGCKAVMNYNESRPATARGGPATQDADMGTA
mmetsp:Transcript_93791/g.271039  ORF Transcript_93791/g.271039 Transcript_93791/m.271039 type:complete len:134 (-) Transcript_93791:172-573(-)